MKMILFLMACLYFFAPPALGGTAMRVLAMLLILKLVFDVPRLAREFFGRRRVM